MHAIDAATQKAGAILKTGTLAYAYRKLLRLTMHPGPLAGSDIGVVERGTVVVALIDLVVVFGVLALVSLVPIPFLVPFNDEWLRMNILEEHTVWEWTIGHSKTWVVRPTAELIMSYASLATTRRALGSSFDSTTFLSRFHATYVVLIVIFWALIVLNARIVARTIRCMPQLTLMFFGVVVCWLMSDELGFAFYWTDGYGNVLIPFALLTCGLPLMCSTDWRQVLAGSLLLVAAALGHEVSSIFAAGFVCLVIVARRPGEHAWLLRTLQAAFLAGMVALLWIQLFGEGPSMRSARYLATAGKQYDLAGAWLNIREIRPLRAVLATLAPILAISLCRDRLRPTVERAVSDCNRQRWFWILLAVGTLATAFLPLGSAGLKKGRLAVSSYSVFTYLWFVLLGFVVYPLLDRWLERGFRPIRKFAPSVIPVLLLVTAGSANLPDFADAMRRAKPLRDEAKNYIGVLFAAQQVPDLAIRLCRPQHVYSKPGRPMSDRNAETYFKLKKVSSRCSNGHFSSLATPSAGP
jgi:hypothetical protein